MADKKVIFVAFAIEDERQRDFLKPGSLPQSPMSPLELVSPEIREGRLHLNDDEALPAIDCYDVCHLSTRAASPFKGN